MRVLILVAALAFLGACDNGGVLGEIKRAEQEEAKSAEEATAVSQRFLEEARARPGAQTTDSGLVIEFVRRGSNQALPHPTANSTVTVHYEGKLADGTTFDSSLERGEPADFPLNQVVPGFTESIMMMRPGDEVIAYFPPDLGYGARGQPPVIPPNAVLQFRIQLLAFQGEDGRVVRAPS